MCGAGYTVEGRVPKLAIHAQLPYCIVGRSLGSFAVVSSILREIDAELGFWFCGIKLFLRESSRALGL